MAQPKPLRRCRGSHHALLVDGDDRGYRGPAVQRFDGVRRRARVRERDNNGAVAHIFRHCLRPLGSDDYFDPESGCGGEEVGRSVGGRRQQ